jgi:hypothetical protein
MFVSSSNPPIIILLSADSKLIHKKEKLVNEFNKLFPNITVEPEFYLSAFYGGLETLHTFQL